MKSRQRQDVPQIAQLVILWFYSRQTGSRVNVPNHYTTMTSNKDNYIRKIIFAPPFLYFWIFSLWYKLLLLIFFSWIKEWNVKGNISQKPMTKVEDFKDK